MYAQVRFNSARSNPPLLVPGEALILRGNGAQLAILRDLGAEDEQKIQQSPDRKNAERMHLQPIEIGRDDGTEIEVSGGREGSEQGDVHPGDAAREGAI